MKEVLAAGHQAADSKVRTTPILAGFENCAIVQRVNPLVAPIAERGIQTTQVDAGTFTEFVIRASSESPPRTVVLVVAQINAVIVRSHAVCTGRRLNVIDAAAVPVICPAKQYSQLFVCAKALAD